MDPNATLEELRRLVESVQEKLDGEEDYSEEVYDDAARMAELFQALDGWISNGGFLPKGWTR